MTDRLDDSALRDGDRAAMRSLGRLNARLREVLCTLARRGRAIRLTEPRRARRILDALAPWPFYKGGQFLFDLLEWEDFMIDGEPPRVLSRAELGALLDVPTRWVDTAIAAVDAHTPDPLRQLTASPQLRWLAATAQSTLRGVVRGLTDVLAPPADPAEVADELPPLEAGFHLYEDVVLGLFDLVGARLPHSAEPEGPGEPGEPDEPGGPSTSPAEPGRPIGVFPMVETFRVSRVDDLDHAWTLRGDATLAGDDGLQLTPAEHTKAGTALLDVPFRSAAGVAIDFDFHCSGGNGDGFALYLIDGAHDTDVGGYGGGLGYALDPDGKGGVTRGWVGVGFDKWGNFSRATAGPTTEDERKPNRIVLRGSGDRDSGFAHIAGVDAPGGLDAVWADRAHVQVVIVDAVLTVRVTRGDTTTTVFDGL
ncbi:MAG: hypothetical protein HOV94_03220, partial [Saccharothrix sp.]|nr:hypothetical protein [Saccharothrix sp.]